MIKHRRIYSLAAATTALGAVLLSGCSGGSDSAASKVASGTTPTSTTSTTVGPVSVQSVGQLTTVTGAGSGVVVTGMYGGTVTGLSFLSLGSPNNGSGSGTGTGGTTGGTGGTGGTGNTKAAGTTTGSNGGGGTSTTIAFTRTTSGTKTPSQIYEMSVNNSNFSVPVNITNNAFACDSAAFSPDGTKIAYSCVNSTGHHQLYVMSANGTGQTDLTNSAASDDYAPSWSPDGTKIAFERHVGTTLIQVCTMTATGQSPTNLSNNTKVFDGQPNWCWATNKIVFTRTGQGIFSMNPDGSSQTHIGATGANDTDPACSYDGTMIAYTHATAASTSGATNSATSDIYVMSSSGSNPKDITNGGGGFLDAMPGWATDDSKIGFQRTQRGVSLIVAANPDGTNLTPITTGGGADSSPAISVPIVQPVVYIGTNGLFGASAAGFLLGQQGVNVTSVVTFNATTPSGVILTAQTGIAPNVPNVVFNLSTADNLTSLSFMNGMNGQPTTVFGGPVGSPLLTPLPTGALISFDANGGGVTSVLPYVTSRAVTAAAVTRPTVQSGVLVYHAQFLGVWNGQGQNLAPHGATEVRIDAHTGRILSAK